jgi:hypothetical protein
MLCEKPLRHLSLLLPLTKAAITVDKIIKTMVIANVSGMIGVPLMELLATNSTCPELSGNEQS